MRRSHQNNAAGYEVASGFSLHLLTKMIRSRRGLLLEVSMQRKDESLEEYEERVVLMMHTMKPEDVPEDDKFYYLLVLAPLCSCGEKIFTNVRHCMICGALNPKFSAKHFEVRTGYTIEHANSLCSDFQHATTTLYSTKECVEIFHYCSVCGARYSGTLTEQ